MTRWETGDDDYCIERAGSRRHSPFDCSNEEYRRYLGRYLATSGQSLCSDPVHGPGASA